MRYPQRFLTERSTAGDHGRPVSPEISSLTEARCLRRRRGVSTTLPLFQAPCLSGPGTDSPGAHALRHSAFVHCGPGPRRDTKLALVIRGEAR
ncbi:hypothetical protein AAFF_G00344210 [Aldrovandia affinis]|uniref:Uncharacterized protein n=1 Tax=Aldrovandia affinis TaxID=143900 RepID=A0AAD7SK15_9TELE|nr:hypothetical protein AAFF_G00344210 [Aldrovandia affinis]